MFQTARDLALRRREFLLSGLGLVVYSSVSSAQQDTTFSTDVKVVNVFATVHDKHGQLVNDLTKDDFVLEEDGRPQQIKYFSRQTDLPLVLGLLVDTSGSMRRLLGKERIASQTFVDQVLRDGKDKFFLIHFDREAELLRDMTSSRKEMEAGLALLDRETEDASSGAGSGGNQGGGGGGSWPGGGGGRRGGGGGGGRRAGGGTVLYDSVLLASNELMRDQTGRKAIVLLTDGEDNGSKVSLEQSISSAQRTDTLAYSVRYAELQERFGGFGGPGMGGRRGGMGGGGMGRGGPMGGGYDRPDGKKVLEQLSKETGGGYFEVSNKITIEDIYAKIEKELRNQYSLGYTSDKPSGAGEFRKIELSTKGKNQIVQTRQGYYAGA